MASYRIAVIPGDGIGREVVPEGIRVLEAAGARYGVAFEFDELPWSCEVYASAGRMMPEDGLDAIRGARRHLPRRGRLSRRTRSRLPVGGC